MKPERERGGIQGKIAANGPGTLGQGQKAIWPESRPRKKGNYDRAEREPRACYVEFGNFQVMGY